MVPINLSMKGSLVGKSGMLLISATCKNTQIGLTLVLTKQWIGTQSLWKSLVGNGRIIYAAQGDSIDIPGMHSESDNAS
jgi:hypothetical protein